MLIVQVLLLLAILGVLLVLVRRGNRVVDSRVRNDLGLTDHNLLRGWDVLWSGKVQSGHSSHRRYEPCDRGNQPGQSIPE